MISSEKEQFILYKHLLHDILNQFPSIILNFEAKN